MKPDGAGFDRRAVVEDPYLTPVREYGETVSRLFPQIDGRMLKDLFAPLADALFVGHFLEGLSGGVTALQVGGTIGDSAYGLAAHPGVSGVVVVNSNPPLAEISTSAGSGSFGETGALDVARAAFGGRADEPGRTTFVEGSPREAIGGSKQEPLPGVALIDGLGERGEVRDALDAVFALNPRVVAFVGDRRRGPFVRAGIADFLGGAGGDLRFRPVGGLGPALAGCGLDVVYAAAGAGETEEALEEAARAFSRKLDPLRLLGREEELKNTVGELGRRLSRAEERGSRLEAELHEVRARLAAAEARGEDLEFRLAGRRYRLADAVAGRALRAPGVKRLLARRNAPSDGEA